MNAYDRTRANEDRTLKDLTPNVAGLLCYVAGWISGIVFLVLEQKNRFVRFHALQSIIVFGILTLAGATLGRIPWIGGWFGTLIGITAFILWIIMMVKAVNGEYFKLPWAGDLADKLTSEAFGPTQPPTPAAGNASEEAKTANLSFASAGFTAGSAAGTGNLPPVVPVGPPPITREARAEEFRARYYSSSQRAGRITGSAIAMAWNAVLLIFLNFYNEYIAYYEQIDGEWQSHTLITSEFNQWLPLVTAALVVGIIGHALVIVYDRYLWRQILGIVTDIFGVVVTVRLLTLFPFDFSSIPNAGLITGVEIGVTVTLIIISVGFGISALVKFIQLIVNSAEGKY